MPTLVVQRIDPESLDTTFAVVDQHGAKLGILTPPPEVAELDVITIHQPPDTEHAVIETAQGLFTMDVATFELKLFLGGGVVNWRDPNSRFLVMTAAAAVEVVDLVMLERYVVGSDQERFGAIGSNGEQVALTTLGTDFFGKYLVDAGAGVVTELAEGGAIAEVPFDDLGNHLLVIRSTQLGDGRLTELLVSPAANPRQQVAWYTSDLQPSGVWGTDQLVVVERAGGAVLLVTADSTHQISNLPEVGTPVLFGDPTSGAVLINFLAGGTSRWFHVDSAAASMRELPELGGLRFSSTVGSTSEVLVLDDSLGNGDFKAARTVAVRIADGHTMELASSQERRLVSGGALSSTFVMVGLGHEVPLEVINLDTGERLTLDGGVFAQLDPDSGLLAVAFGRAPERTTSLVDLATGEIRHLTEGNPLAWLQR